MLNIFKILAKESDYKDFLYRMINVAMFMKASKSVLHMDIPDVENRRFFINYFDEASMNNASFDNEEKILDKSPALLIIPKMLGFDGITITKPYYLILKENYISLDIFSKGKGLIIDRGIE